MGPAHWGGAVINWINFHQSADRGRPLRGDLLPNGPLASQIAAASTIRTTRVGDVAVVRFFHVSWNDIKTEFLPWLSHKTQKRYRLPTEDEWNYAAAAGSRGLFTWGDDIVRGQANCAACGGPWDNRQSAPVGSFGPNAFGLYDVHGNVWERVEDCVEFNVAIPRDGGAVTGPQRCWRGLRGGAWDTAQGDLHLSSRGRNWPELRSHTVGFRVVRELN